MQKLLDNQQILNSAMDKQNFTIKGTSKNGNKQFLQYYIDNNKLNELLPIQLILNAIFDRQSSSICIKGSSDGEVNISNYAGDVSISTSDNKNVITVDQNNDIIIGNTDNNVTINASDFLLNGNGLNTPNGLVTLNENGKIDNSFISLQYDPSNLQVVQDITNLYAEQVYFTIKNSNGEYKLVTLQQLSQLFSPKLQIIQE